MVDLEVLAAVARELALVVWTVAAVCNWYPWCCRPSILCGPCKEGSSAQRYQLEMTGWADGNCSGCSVMNGTFILTAGSLINNNQFSCLFFYDDDTAFWPFLVEATGSGTVCAPNIIDLLGRPELQLSFVTTASFPNTGPPMIVTLRVDSRRTLISGPDNTGFNRYNLRYTYPDAASQPNCLEMDQEALAMTLVSTFNNTHPFNTGNAVACDGTNVVVTLTALEEEAA